MTPTHIVAASALVTNAAGQILLVRSPRRGWEMPGGQVEEGETLIGAVRREIHEETGTNAQVNTLTGVYSNLKLPTKVIFNFTASYLDGDLIPSSESPEVAWVARDDVLARITHPAIRDRVYDALHFDGTVRYRAYTLDPYTLHTNHAI